MANQTNLDKLVDFSCFIGFKNHLYVQDDLTLGSKKTKALNLESLINKAKLEVSDRSKQTDFNMCLENIENHLTKKINRFFGLFVSRDERERIQSQIGRIQSLKFNIEFPVFVGYHSHKLRFYRELTKSLNVKDAPNTKELGILGEIDFMFYMRSKDFEEYKKWMFDFYQGEHFLTGATFSELQLRRNYVQHGKLRSSSHYDFGSVDHKKGGKVPANKAAAKAANVRPQYEVVGPHLKTLLIGKVEFEVDKDGKPLLDKRITKNSKPADANTGKFYFFQTEWAPDSSNPFTKNFWKHRVLSFGFYGFRKSCRFEKPNVGPYGYGHGDNNPTIILPRQYS